MSPAAEPAEAAPPAHTRPSSAPFFLLISPAVFIFFSHPHRVHRTPLLRPSVHPPHPLGLSRVPPPVVVIRPPVCTYVYPSRSLAQHFRPTGSAPRVALLHTFTYTYLYHRTPTVRGGAEKKDRSRDRAQSEEYAERKAMGMRYTDTEMVHAVSSPPARADRASRMCEKPEVSLTWDSGNAHPRTVK